MSDSNLASQNLSPAEARERLVERYPDRPELAEETVYALHPAFIAQLEREKVLEQSDLEFERDLVRYGGYGLFLKASIGYGFPQGVTPEHCAKERDEIQRRHLKNKADINDLIANEHQLSQGRMSGYES